MRAMALALLVLAGGTAHAQRAAVSANLSPEAAGAAFKQAVASVCVHY